MPSPYLDGFLSLLIIFASLLQCCCKIKKQGFDANCCSSIFCSRQPEVPRALFFFSAVVTQMNSFREKTGQCTVTASKELKQQDVIFPLSPVLSKHITDSSNLDTRNILVWLHSVTAQ